MFNSESTGAWPGVKVRIRRSGSRQRLVDFTVSSMVKGLLATRSASFEVALFACV